MPKTRKRGAGLQNRKKHHRAGERVKIRHAINGNQVGIINDFKSIDCIVRNDVPKDVVISENNYLENNYTDRHKIQTDEFYKRRRMAIVFVYEHIFNSMPRHNWKRVKVIHQIVELLRLGQNAHRMVEKVLDTFLESSKSGVNYNGNKKYNKWSDCKHLLSLTSNECKIIADIIEDGHGLRAAHQFVNEYR